MRALMTTMAILAGVGLLYGAAYLLGYQERISATGQPFGAAKAFKVCPVCDRHDYDILRATCQQCGYVFFDDAINRTATEESPGRVSGRTDDR